MQPTIQSHPPQQQHQYNPGGLGPWWCQLLFSVSNVPKKQTHLCSHTYPHLYESVMNKTAVSSSSGGGGGGGTNATNTVVSQQTNNSSVTQKSTSSGWTTVQVVGPFEKWRHAIVFQKLWSDHTRGKLRRLQQGVGLLAAFHEQYNLFMETPIKNRDTILEERHFVLPTAANVNQNETKSNGATVIRKKRVAKRKRCKPRNVDLPLKELEQTVNTAAHKNKFDLEMVERLQIKRRVQKRK